ncbi:type IV pilus biogenesis/stability protein PilW [Woeseia oceani]|uniref:Type IV pilus biogenesis/stability protein PilW n=1 Tax=Woeseia oceani TaxID=1548547 RepID=A0A193LE78_9GAMM|nr:type IV pilus biogenesis/stability protein PilW [Woeseia oceani]ANO50812.1 type IV pilus biogenesis/stability protein PilW [Woeseia oceani]
MTIRIGVLLALVLLLNACVSTTTGRPRAEPKSSAEAAAQYYQLGARYYRNGTYELARDRLLRAIELDPKLAVAQSTLALTYVGLENPRLAEQHFDRAVRLAPDDVDVRNSYAVFLCQQKRYDDAHEQFQRLRRATINDRPEVMLTNGGVCMAQKPDYALAESYFRDALEFKPGYAEALLQMTLLKRAQGEDLASRAFLQRYLASNPPTPTILWLGVEIERTIGDERARSEFETRLLREFPDSAQAKRVLADR